MSNNDPKSVAARVRAYRGRLAATGRQPVMFELPTEAIAIIDAVKERRGLRNRSQALLQLIEGRGATVESA